MRQSNSSLLLNMVIEAHKLGYTSIDAQDEFVANNQFLLKKIEDRILTDSDFSRHICMAIYHLIETNHRQYLIDNWPLTLDELAPFFHDLGVAIEHFR